MEYLGRCGTTWDWKRKYLPALFHDPDSFNIWMSKVRIQPANYQELECIVLGILSLTNLIKLLIFLSALGMAAREILQAMEMEEGVETNMPPWVFETSLEISHLTKLLDNRDWNLEILVR
jgi:hypothetical protein